MNRNWIAGAVTILFVAPVLWMAMDRQPPYTGHVGRLIPPDPRPGDPVSVEWKLTIHRVCDGWVQREVIDSQGVICVYERQPAIRRDQLFGQQKGSEADRLNRQFRICERAATGPARYRAITCYECNPLQRWWPVCTRTPDINFTIRPP